MGVFTGISMTKRKAGTMTVESAPVAPQPASENVEDEAEECVICLGSSPDKGRLKCVRAYEINVCEKIVRY